jgi:hypothetical protein
MSMKKRKVLCVGVVALLLLGLIGCAIGASSQAQNSKGAGKGVAGLVQADDAEDSASLGVQNGPAKLIHRCVGFALNGSDYHVLTLHILGVRQLHPAEMRALISSEKSIGEIRAELLATGTRQLKGYLRLGTHLYRLDNLSVDESETNRTFTADLVYPAWDPDLGEASTMIGTITVTVRSYEGARIGEGQLTMDEGDYRGEYRVLLTVQPPLPIRLGREQ